MYRVRESWIDASSQIGEYRTYKDAFMAANAHPGYSVFDEDGNTVYTATQTVKTMSYRAKLLRKIGKHGKGSKVTLTRNLKKEWVMGDGTVVDDKRKVDLLAQIYDATCKYTRKTAQGWINAMRIGSETDWLIWCSKYCQRIYIFSGYKGHWLLEKTFKCGTGNIAYGDGADQGVGFKWKIWDKDKAYQGPRAMQYWNQHYSSKWGNSIHKGLAGKPTTHGCISLGESAAKWVFFNIPVNTRVVVY